MCILCVHLLACVSVSGLRQSVYVVLTEFSLMLGFRYEMDLWIFQLEFEKKLLGIKTTMKDKEMQAKSFELIQ